MSAARLHVPRAGTGVDRSRLHFAIRRVISSASGLPSHLGHEQRALLACGRVDSAPTHGPVRPPSPNSALTPKVTRIEKMGMKVAAIRAAILTKPLNDPRRTSSPLRPGLGFRYTQGLPSFCKEVGDFRLRPFWRGGGTFGTVDRCPSQISKSGPASLLAHD